MGDDRKARIENGIEERRERFASLVRGAGRPTCVHEVLEGAGLDPANPAGGWIVTSLLAPLVHPTDGRPSTFGRAIVRHGANALFRDAPRDAFFWVVSPDRGGRATDLFRWGPDWQGSLLAARVDAHDKQFPKTVPTNKIHQDEIVI